jgi:hypothetical protein
LAETNATSLGQLNHFGQHFTLQAASQCTQRHHFGAIEFFSSEAQHFD